jgi:hypothetical protein
MAVSPFNLDQMQQSGIALAKAGRRAEARDLLVQLVAADPSRELAWAWLSDLMDGLEDRVIALENAQALNPGCRSYEDRLVTLREQQAQRQASGARQSHEWMRQAAAALKGGHRDLALDLARHVTVVEPQAESAWLLVSRLSPDMAEQESALDAALQANPGRETTRRRLKEIQALRATPLLLGQAYEQRGELNLAMGVYRQVFAGASSREEKIEAATRLDFATFYREFSEVKPLNPNQTVLRLAAGPVLLYMLLLLVESGLNPLHAPLLPLLGLIPELLGSFLLVLATNRPRHPFWIRAFGSPGRGEEPLYRGLATAAGWLMLLTPYLLLLLDALERLARFAPFLREGG